MTIIIFSILISLAFQTELCDQRILKENAKKELGEYKYDLSKLTKITYKTKPQLKETEVVLFLGGKYKLIFNTEAVPKPIIVNLYNKDKDSKRRKLLFSSKDLPPDKKFLVLNILSPEEYMLVIKYLLIHPIKICQVVFSLCWAINNLVSF